MQDFPSNSWCLWPFISGI